MLPMSALTRRLEAGKPCRWLVGEFPLPAKGECQHHKQTIRLEGGKRLKEHFPTHSAGLEMKELLDLMEGVKPK